MIIKNSTNQTYKGINLSGDYEIGMSINKSINTLIENGTFKDLKTAIWIRNSPNTIIKNCTFIDCEVGIDADVTPIMENVKYINTKKSSDKEGMVVNSPSVINPS